MLRTAKYILYAILHFLCVVGILKLFCLVSPCFLKSFFSSIVNFIVCLIIARYTFVYTKRKFLNQKISSQKKAVLITGCDSGFGHDLAKRLDSRGFLVFATCLFPEGKGAGVLRNQGSERLKVLGMDVTKDDSVNAAFQYVKDNLGDSVLWAVVNNAGIQKGFTADLASLQDFKDTMEVNGFGMVRVTKTFLPLLKQSRGRIVNLTSYDARVAAPHNTPYSMSKYAAAGFSDSLRMEMSEWGIQVIQVEPELFRTMLTDMNEVGKRFDLEESCVKPTLVQEYGKEYCKNLKMATINLLTTFYSPKLDPVVDALEEGVSAEHPSIAYRPSRNDFAAVLSVTNQLLPYAASDLVTKVIKYCFSFPKPKAA